MLKLLLDIYELSRWPQTQMARLTQVSDHLGQGLRLPIAQMSVAPQKMQADGVSPELRRCCKIYETSASLTCNWQCPAENYEA